ARANLRGAGAASARQIRQRRERRTRSAEMIEQRAKGARPHILAADEAEPIDPLLIAQTYWLRALAHPNPKNKGSKIEQLQNQTAERTASRRFCRCFPNHGTERVCCKTRGKAAQSGLPQGYLGAEGVVGASASRRAFRVVLIKPSHYDQDGYVIQWWRSTLP